MAYVTYEEYAMSGGFGYSGELIDESNFCYLAGISSDVIDALVTRPITDDVDRSQLVKATIYQVEYLAAQGGAAAISGAAESQQIMSERLDDYSVTVEQSAEARRSMPTVNGIPVSPLTLSILRKLGLMSRWYYSGLGGGNGGQ